ncbi:myoD family inhibitor domain-containing protein 2 [Clinocottus analis]|uniref:myoD family inhibitor domain-containing protein 2 n=1 Tax=Clinocottus analis TaxID=304258 RepID=UPI0035C0840D
MDVTSHCDSSDITESRANQKLVQSECVSVQPAANGKLPHHTDVLEEAPPSQFCDWSEDAVDDTVTDSSSTNDVARLLPSQQKGCGPVPVCLSGVDSSSLSPPPPLPPPRPPYRSTNQKHLSSTKSHASMRSDAAHIKEVAGDDWCVHCLLACLFCELPSMFSAVGECLVCAVGGAWCCDAAVGCCCSWWEVACTEEACEATLDCGIWEDCCGSSNCLEVCLECCSICFHS